MQYLKIIKLFLFTAIPNAVLDLSFVFFLKKKYKRKEIEVWANDQLTRKDAKDWRVVLLTILGACPYHFPSRLTGFVSFIVSVTTRILKRYKPVSVTCFRI